MDFINKIIAWFKELFGKKSTPPVKPVIETCTNCDQPLPGNQTCPDCGRVVTIPPMISVTLTPINSNPKIPVDTICTFSDAIVANVTSTGLSCPDCINYEWYDNNVFIPGHNKNTLKNVPDYRFLVNHFIVCKVSTEGVEAISKPVKLT